MKKVLLSLAVGIGVIVGSIAIIGTGLIIQDKGMDIGAYFKQKGENIDREVFENSKSYVGGMISDLAEHEKELRETEDLIERKAIADYINEKYANFDDSKIDSGHLRDFLDDIRNGNID